MASLTIELSQEQYAQLQSEAAQQGKAPASLVQEWVANHLTPEQTNFLAARERAGQILRAAGRLSELHPELRKMAKQAIPLEEVQKILGRDPDSKPLSEIVIEQRGPKF